MRVSLALPRWAPTAAPRLAGPAALSSRPSFTCPAAFDHFAAPGTDTTTASSATHHRARFSTARAGAAAAAAADADGSGSGGGGDGLPHLRATVRSGDFEGYLCGLFVPSSAVRSYYVMRALNIEVASVRDAARSNPSAAHLRMGFWRDLVNACVAGGGGWVGWVAFVSLQALRGRRGRL